MRLGLILLVTLFIMRSLFFGCFNAENIVVVLDNYHIKVISEVLFDLLHTVFNCLKLLTKMFVAVISSCISHAI